MQAARRTAGRAEEPCQWPPAERRGQGVDSEAVTAHSSEGLVTLGPVRADPAQHGVCKALAGRGGRVPEPAPQLHGCH